MECNNYYVKNKQELIDMFKSRQKFQNEILSRYFEPQKVEYWINKSEKMFTELIPYIPNIGGQSNIMLSFLTNSSILIPIAKILKEDGINTRLIGKIIFQIMEQIYDMIPLKNRLAINREFYLNENIDKWRKHAEDSHKREYSGDWVLNFIEGKDDFLYGLDMTECALFKFWKSQELEELVPYLCLMDWAYWKVIGIKVRRTKTIANGETVCNYRYLGRAVTDDCSRGWPPETLNEWTGKYEK